MSDPPTGRRWDVEVEGTTSTVTMSNDWVARRDGADPAVARSVLKSGVRTIQFDTRKLGRWDSGLIAFLLGLREASAASGGTFDEDGLPEPARRLLQLVPKAVAHAPARPRTPVLDRVGLRAIAVWIEVVETTALVGNTVLRSAALVRGRAAMRVSDLFDAMYDAGPAALPIVAVVGVLVGGILAFIGATELSKLGPGVYVADLVAVGMVREMAALMTAIIMAGRTGGAYAASIAAMEGGEELDALKAIGINVFDYLILPRILALAAMMPILYLFGCVVGIAGGLVVEALTLNVTMASAFVEAQHSLSITQFALGLGKSISFGIFVAIVACRVGLRADRSAAAVGTAATTAVVIGIVGVIALDAIFDMCASVTGI